MIDEERNKIEERIMAYFDGTLNGADSKALLSEIAVDSEKQSLFDSHAALNRLISSARVPFETPLETNRSLAERIPGLLAFLPQLFAGAETAAVVTQSNPSLSFFSRFSVANFVAAGASVVLLTCTGILIKNSLDYNSTIPAHHHIQSAQIPIESAQIPAVTPAQSPSANEIAETPPELASNENFHVRSANDLSMNGASVLRDHSSSRSLNRDMNREAIHRLTFSHDAKSSGDAVTTDSPLKSSQTDASSSEAMLAEIQPHTVGIEPPHVGGFEGRLLNESPFVETSKLGIKPYFGNGLKMVFLPKVVAPVNSANDHPNASGLMLANTPFAGIDVDIADRTSIRAEVGQSYYAQITPYTTPETLLGYSRIQRNIHQTSVNFISSTYSVAGLAYELNPDDAIRFVVSGDAGMVWLSPTAMTAGLGVSGEWSWTSKVSLRGAVNLENAWVKQAADSEPIDQTGEIVHRELSATTINNFAVGISVGLILHY